MGVYPFSEPPHPRLLLDSLYGFRPIANADPRNGLRRRHAREDGHARQHGSRATASAQATDLDDAAISPSSERLHDPHDRLGLAWAVFLRREAPPSRIGVALAPNHAHTDSVPELLTALLIAILFATPWIGAIALVCWRAGARLLWSEADEVFPTQSSQWRGSGAR